MGKKYYQTCPKCNSIDVSTDFSNPAAVNCGGLDRYICNHCGFVGTFFPEVEESELQLVKKLKDIPKRNLVNTEIADIIIRVK